MRTSVDHERCTGHGRCYTVAPRVYAADDEGRSRARHTEVPAELRRQARIAAQECPERAVTVDEDPSAPE